MSSSQLECRHGNTRGCPECLINSLREYQQVLSDPDISNVLDVKTLTSFKLFTRKAIARTEQEINLESQLRGTDEWSIDEEPQYFSPKNDPAPAQPARFQPTIVSGSAFGSNVPPTRVRSPTRSTSVARPEQSVSPARGADRLPGILQKPRASWVPDEVEDLRRAVAVYGTSWESIRKKYQSLKKYSGVQLKDKWRVIGGNRAI